MDIAAQLFAVLALAQREQPLYHPIQDMRTETHQEHSLYERAMQNQASRDRHLSPQPQSFKGKQKRR